MPWNLMRPLNPGSYDQPIFPNPLGVGRLELFHELQYAAGTNHNQAELCAR